MKKQPFYVLSDRKCEHCGKQLKANLVNQRPNAKYCYPHYQQLVKKNPSYFS